MKKTVPKISDKSADSTASPQAKHAHPFFASAIQPKLSIGSVGDPYEREADAMADQVMDSSPSHGGGGSFFKASPPSISRKCQHCEEEEKKLQRKEGEGLGSDSGPGSEFAGAPAGGGSDGSPGGGSGGLGGVSGGISGSGSGGPSGSSGPGVSGGPADASTESYVGGLQGKGRALTPEERNFFEPKFGYDFSQVQLHTDAGANESAQNINARAYTYGNNIVFGSGQYQPGTVSGTHLMAHELTHVIQQDNGIHRISRATYMVGRNQVNINYEPVFKYVGGEYEQGLMETYTRYTGKPADALKTKVAAYSDDQKRLLMYALDLLSDNPLGNFDKDVAVDRLVAKVPGMTTHPWGEKAGLHDFEDEVLRISGWFETAATAGLKKPSAQDQSMLDVAYNYTISDDADAGSTCPSPRPASAQLDEKKFRADMKTVMTTYLAEQVKLLSKQGPTQDIKDVNPIASIVQQEALSLFSPYMGKSMAKDYLQTWDYSKHIISSKAPGAIPADVKDSFLLNRGDKQGNKSNVFTNTHYDPRCKDDADVFKDTMQQFGSDPTVQSQLDAIMAWQSFTPQKDDPTTVVSLITLPNENQCAARWRIIKTVCHELMHSYAHPDFLAMERGRGIIGEGFTEVLGQQLYQMIAKKAGSDPQYRAKFEGGLGADTCSNMPVPDQPLKYGDDGRYADRIRMLVGDDKFRAAYFMGKNTLAGLRPKLQTGNPDTPEEREADTMADKVTNASAPIQGEPGVQRAAYDSGEPGIQRQVASGQAGPLIQRQPQTPGPGQHVPSPADAVAVANAKRRLAIIEPKIKALAGRQTEIEGDRLGQLANRETLDRTAYGADMNAAMVGDPLLRQHMEDKNISALNKLPIHVNLTDREVTINVKFQVKFEDPAMKSKFADVTANMNKGLDMIWNQNLSGAAFGGKKFKVVPSYQLVDAAAPRDQNFWLILIRKNDLGAISYPGCTVANPGNTVPTSVTDSNCDGGVMFVPPSHISKPDVLGHEVLHLFGLVDRYFFTTTVPPKGSKAKPVVTHIPLREEHGYADPLAADTGKVRDEDLAYLFDRLGVYKQEENRSTQGLSELEGEAMRLRNIVQLGYDPNSLLPIRTNFNDKMIKDAENL
jgi:hypothetical protein